MERQEIDVFLTMAEELHFRRTGELLGLASGRVSQIIGKLERRFGAPLFVRTSRSVSLTPLGRQLRDELGPAYRQVQTAVARATTRGRSHTGSLRVGYSTPWVCDLLVRAADTFRAENPECDVRIQEIQLHDPFTPLRSGAVHVQVSEFPVKEPDLIAGPVLFSETRALIVPATHPFAARASLSLEDLADTRLIAVAGRVPDYWLDYHYPRHTPSGREIPRGPGVVYWQEALSWVAAGKGVTPASLRGQQFHGRPDIVFRPFHDAPPVEYGLIWPVRCETLGVADFARTVCATAQLPTTTRPYGHAAT